MKKKFKLALAGFAGLACSLLSFSLTVNPMAPALKGLNRVTRTLENELDDKGVYYNDFSSYDDAYDYAAEVNRELCREGITVLKNDGGMPLSTVTERRVSIFGHSQDDPMVCGTGGKVIPDVGLHEALENEGFIINDTLHTWYENNPETRYQIRINMGSNTTYGYERTDFDEPTEKSFDLYNDVAILYLSRFSGEGADMSTDLENVNLPDVVNYKEGEEYAHENESDPGEHLNEISGHKHSLELTDYEQALLDEIESHPFKKIVVVLNSSNVMEIGSLLDDDRITGVIWQGRPGKNGFTALAEILDGKVNPSGRTSDIWIRDFTTDPTWFNFALGEQVGLTDGDIYYYDDGTPTGPNRYFRMPFDPSGYFGVDYEEGIYLGYKYWETRYAEIYKAFGADVADEWYKQYVTMPFGGGLGYSTFTFEEGGIYTDEDCTTALEATVTPDIFSSSEGNIAQVEKLYIPVTVTNTGKYAGKQTIEIYVEAPYTSGEIEKSAVVLVGFDKTDILEPGESQTVTVEINVQDFASYDATDANNNGNKGYELDPGEYKIWALDSSHVERGGNWGTKPHDVKTFTISGEAPANLILDDYSHKPITNKFSEENGIFYTLRRGVNSTANDEERQLTRAEMNVKTEQEMEQQPSFPNAPVDGHMGDTTVEGYEQPYGRMFSKETIKKILRWELFEADKISEYSTWDTDKSPDSNDTWADDVSVPDGWTQATEHATDYSDVTIKLRDMADVNPDTTEGAAKWDEFLNQLTWDELVSICQNVGYGSIGVASIDKYDGTSADSPENFAGGYDWCCEPIISATYNTELVYQHGIVTADLGAFEGVDGWYGPGANTHRSPFSGRNYQYYSQDGIHAGIIGAADVAGAESRGTLVTVKHFLCNDEEANRASEIHFTWLSEQALRENYLPAFKMSLQEGNAGSVMTACARIGMVPCQGNYSLMTGVLRDEMDWHGYAITDGFGPLEKPTSLDLMMRCGTMPLGDEREVSTQTVQVSYDSSTKTASTIKRDTKISGTWDNTLRSGKGSVMVGGNSYETLNENNEVVTVAAEDNPAQQSDAQYYFVRKRAKEVLYNSVHSQLNYNGVKMDSVGRNGQFTYNATTDLGTFKQGDEVSVSVAASADDLNGRTPFYSTEDLPDGLTLNTSTGAITGVAAGKTGTFSITVNARIDNWITSSKTFTYTVDSNISWTGDDVSAAKVGQTFSGYVETTIEAKQKDTGGFPGFPGFPGGGQQEDPTLSYSITEGELPDGLTLGEDGRISGTPTTAGTYTFTVTIDDNQNTYDYEMTITVAAEDVVDETEAKIAELEQEIADLQAKIDASTDATEIAALKEEVADLQAQLAELEDKLDSTTDSTSGTTTEETGGCGGSIVAATSAIGAIALLGAGLAIKKKKEEK